MTIFEWMVQNGDMVTITPNTYNTLINLSLKNIYGGRTLINESAQNRDYTAIFHTNMVTFGSSKSEKTPQLTTYNYAPVITNFTEIPSNISASSSGNSNSDVNNAYGSRNTITTLKNGTVNEKNEVASEEELTQIEHSTENLHKAVETNYSGYEKVTNSPTKSNSKGENVTTNEIKKGDDVTTTTENSRSDSTHNSESYNKSDSTNFTQKSGNNQISARIDTVKIEGGEITEVEFPVQFYRQLILQFVELISYY